MELNAHVLRRITFVPDGHILGIEEQVEFDSLAAKALKVKAGSSEITTVESISKEGKLLAYEAK